MIHSPLLRFLAVLILPIVVLASYWLPTDGDSENVAMVSSSPLVEGNWRGAEARTVESFGPEERLEAEALQAKARILAKAPQLLNLLELTDGQVKVFANSANKQANRPEFVLSEADLPLFAETYQHLEHKEFLAFWQRKMKGEQVAFQPKTRPSTWRPTADRPLVGLRVAIDPGHVGGTMDMALTEGKYIRMMHNDNLVEFNEGNLTLSTALFLEEKLKEAGAEVMLTRRKTGLTVFGNTYWQWLNQDQARVMNEELSAGRLSQADVAAIRKGDPKIIFHRLFRNVEFRERARLINEFAPDLTIIIHYNVDERNFEQRDKQREILPQSPYNYAMAFVPGAFLDFEMNSPAERITFLRLLATDELNRSIALSAAVMQAHAQLLGIELASDKQHWLTYLTKSSVATPQPGVYARNLSLNRLIKGPICYGESLCQDAETEFLQLAELGNPRNGLPMPPRTERVAEAYFQGILSYAQQQMR